MKHPATHWGCPILCLALAAVGLMGFASLARAGTGGPDAAGYSWVDSDSGLTDTSIPAIAGPIGLNLPNDTVTAVVLPPQFPSFSWYGIDTSTLWVSGNGWIAFSAPPGPETIAQSMPDAAAPNQLLAFFWRQYSWLSAGSATIGPTATGDAYVLRFDLISSMSVDYQMAVVLYQDGRAKVVYERLANTGTGAIGTENLSGGTGLGLWYMGSGASDFALRADFAVEILPPPNLDCSSTVPVNCGDIVVFTGPPPQRDPNATHYPCAPGATHTGNEVVYELTLETISDVTAILTGFGSRNLHAFILDDNCNEFMGCLEGGSSTAEASFLQPGTYYIVVDGVGQVDDGAFTLRAQCRERVVDVACGDVQAGGTAGSSLTNSYSCTPELLAGPEVFSRVNVSDGSSKLEAGLLSGPVDGRVLIAPADFDPLVNPVCLAAGRATATLFDPPAGDYIVIVDAEAGSGPYELDVRCQPDLVCSPDPVWCGQTLSDTTATGTMDVNAYSCQPGEFTGPERVYVLDNPLQQHVALNLLNAEPGLEVLLLDDCDEADCLSGSAVGSSCLDLPAGRHYVVVDGLEGAEGPFELEVSCSALRPGWEIVVGDLDLSGMLVDVQTLGVAGSVSFSVFNLGLSTIPASFMAVVFEDRDGSGDWSGPANDNLLGQGTVLGPVNPGEPIPVDVPVTGTVLFRDNWVWVHVDSFDSVPETNETNNTAESGVSCAWPPSPGSFNAEVEWEWSENTVVDAYHHVDMTPVVVNLTDDNADGTIDDGDIPDVAFVAGSRGNGFSDGVVVALSGDTGQELWVSDPSNPVYSSNHLAAGDIDGDGMPEIVGVDFDDNPSLTRLMAFEHDGAFKWASDPPTSWDNMGGSAPSIADLDLDGVPEVIYGRDVFDNTGRLLCSGIAGQGSAVYPGYGLVAPMSTVADLDLDGVPEIVAGNTAYRNDCSIFWTSLDVGDGFPAVANMDGDPYPEVVVVNDSQVHLLDHDGATIWSRSAPTTGGGPPTISDVDNDCLPEIGVAFNEFYVLFDADGSIRWQSPTTEGSSGITGSSVFDFNGDGLEEIVYNDEQDLRIFSGLDGSVPWTLANTSHTWAEMPVIADVDRDQRAEIVVVANDSSIAPGNYGVRLVGEPTWVNTRRTWNQHTYHITNVGDDADIPLSEIPNWEVYNNFRTQVGGAILDAPDASASLLVLTCAPDDMIEASMRVGSAGHVEIAGDIEVSFYSGDPAAGGQLLVTLTVPGPLTPESFEDLSNVLLPALPAGSLVYVVVDDPAAYDECDELNNTTQALVPECNLAVNYSHYGAVRTAAGVHVTWGTSMESDSFGFEVWARDARDESWKLPGLIYAAGAGTPYEMLDTSDAARSGQAVAYRVLEQTFSGPGDTTPWFAVQEAPVGEEPPARGGRNRELGR